MKHKQYNIGNDERPTAIAAEPVAHAYGAGAYNYMYDNSDLLGHDSKPDTKATFEDDEYEDNESYNAAEWDEIEREGVILGIEQMLRGKCYTAEEVFDHIRERLGWN